MRIAKLFLIFALVFSLFAPAAFGASFEDSVRNEFLAQPLGRTVTTGTSVVMTLTYDDGTSTLTNLAEAGTSSNSTVFNLYEVGQIVTATRFSGEDGAIDLTAAAYDTLGELIDAINSDTSGYWNAELGRDAHRDMASQHIFPKAATDAIVNAASPVEFFLFNDEARAYSAGAKGLGESNGWVRLKYVEESTTASKGPHWLEVYSDETVIYRRGFTAAETCTRDQASEPIGATGDTASPNTISFSDSYNKGVAVLPGENLVVVSQWDTGATMYADSVIPATSNLSIIYDVYGAL